MKNIDDTLRALHAARNDLSVAFRIMDGLELVASNADIIMLLDSALGSKDSEVRSGAAYGYWKLFSDCKTQSLPLLIKAAADSAPWVAFHAAIALLQIHKRDPSCGLHTKEVARLFVASLESEDPQVRAAAANEFCRVKWRAAWVFHRLVARLDDPVLEVRLAVASNLCWCLITHGAPLKFLEQIRNEALPKFLEWISNEDVPEEVFYGSVAVIRMDDSYREALLPGLLESFGRLGDPFRAKAILLLRFFPKEPRIVAMLGKCYHESYDRDVRLAAVEMFAESVRAEVREAHPLLIEALLDEEPDVVVAAAFGLLVLGQDAAAAVPNLVAVLDAEIRKIEAGSLRERDPWGLVVRYVCDILGRLGAVAEPAVPLLWRALKQDNYDFQHAAWKALSEMGFEPNMTMQPTPIYLRRTMEEWLAAFYSDEYVEGMELLCEALPRHPVKVSKKFREQQSPDATNLMCKALSCFGVAFIEEAVRTLDNLEDRKQARLILCIADAGCQSIPYLVRLLGHSSANVRAAACLGLAEIFDLEPDWPADIEQRVAVIFDRVAQSEAAWGETFEQFDAAFASNSRAEVRARAAAPLARVNKRFDWDQERRDEVVPTLAELLHDKVREVRIAAAHALNLIGKASRPDVDLILAAELGDMDSGEMDCDKFFEPKQCGQAPVIPASVENFQMLFSDLFSPPIESGLPDHICMLIASLGGADIAARFAAIEGFVKIDSPEQDASSELLDMLNDPCVQVCWSTKQALLKILMNRAAVWNR
ncbi:MAG: hypothetical protein WCJ35_19440 [Planctomycetota bacterium]